MVVVLVLLVVRIKYARNVFISGYDYFHFHVIVIKALSHDIRTIFSPLRARRSYHAPLIEKS